jgi:hypothetical protein
MQASKPRRQGFTVDRLYFLFVRLPLLARSGTRPMLMTITTRVAGLDTGLGI